MSTNSTISKGPSLFVVSLCRLRDWISAVLGRRTRLKLASCSVWECNMSTRLAKWKENRRDGRNRAGQPSRDRAGRVQVVVHDMV